MNILKKILRHTIIEKTIGRIIYRKRIGEKIQVDTILWYVIPIVPCKYSIEYRREIEKVIEYYKNDLYYCEIILWSHLLLDKKLIEKNRNEKDYNGENLARKSFVELLKDKYSSDLSTIKMNAFINKILQKALLLSVKLNCEEKERNFDMPNHNYVGWCRINLRTLENKKE